MRLAILLLLFSCGPLAAQDGRPLTITDAGYFLTTIDADGLPSYVRLTTIVDLTHGDKPGPDDPGGPSVDAELVKKVKAWSAAVDDPQSAQAIAMVYAHIRGAVEDGTLTDDTVWVALQKATVSALALIDSGKDWARFRSQVTDVLTEASQRGQLSTAKQIERILLSVQHGVELSADGSTALTMDQMVTIASRTNDAIDGATK